MGHRGPQPTGGGLGWATAFAPNDAEAAQSQGRKVADQLRSTLPKRAALMDEHSKIMVTRLGDRIRVAGMAELVGHDPRIRADRCALLVRLTRALLPRGLAFLLGIFPNVENNLLIGDYYSFVLRFLLAFGIAFLYPVFLFAAAAAGVVSSEQLARGRRWAILIVVTGAALITPTGDILTLAALAIPLYLMYEITYWLIRLLLKK